VSAEHYHIFYESLSVNYPCAAPKFTLFLQVPLLRTKDIGWEHAVDLDGNKRRWQCKFCSLSRSGGVTTLKAHLTDESCPNVPNEISKKVSNFIQEKRAMRLLFSNFAFTIDDDQVSDSQIQEQGTLQNENDQQPSRKATHKCTINEVSHAFFF
jgi:hypothetical protein